MTTRPDGTTICNGCGGVLEDGGLKNAVVVVAMTRDGQVATLHYCLFYDRLPTGLQLDEDLGLSQGHRRCGGTLLGPFRTVGVPGLDTLGRFPLYDPS